MRYQFWLLHSREWQVGSGGSLVTDGCRGGSCGADSCRQAWRANPCRQMMALQTPSSFGCPVPQPPRPLLIAQPLHVVCLCCTLCRGRGGDRAAARPQGGAHRRHQPRALVPAAAPHCGVLGRHSASAGERGARCAGRGETGGAGGTAMANWGWPPGCPRRKPGCLWPHHHHHALPSTAALTHLAAVATLQTTTTTTRCGT